MITISTQAMADRYLVGRTIARVSVSRMESDHHAPATHVGKIVFTDGSSVVLSVAEQETEYAVTATRFKP